MPLEPMPKQTAAPKVLVRVGNTSWTLGDNVAVPVEDVTDPSIPVLGPNILTSLNSTKRPNRASHRRFRILAFSPRFRTRKFTWVRNYLRNMGRKANFLFHSKNALRDIFQAGLIFGLLLGSMTLVLFHQVHPETPAVSQSVSTQSNSTVIAIQPGKYSMQVPGIKLYGATFGSFASRRDADHLRTQLQNKGISAQILHIRDWNVVSNLSVQPGDAAQAIAAINKKNGHASSFAVNEYAKNVALASSTTKQDADSLTRFLNNATSAFVTAAAWYGDGADIANAQQAIQQAVALEPSTRSIENSGLKEQFQTLEVSLSGLQKAVHVKNKLQAAETVASGLSVIFQWTVNQSYS